MVEPADDLIMEDTNADAHRNIRDIGVNIEVEEIILSHPSIFFCCKITLL